MKATEMVASIELLEGNALASLNELNALEYLEKWRLEYLGRQGLLTTMLRNVAHVQVEERPLVGAVANRVKQSLVDALADKEAKLKLETLSAAIEQESIDVTLPGRPIRRGRLHPTTQTVREVCRQYRQEFCSRYPDTKVIYASKAFTNVALVGLLREEGLGLDVASGGELAVGLTGGMPPPAVYFHGNNKTNHELQMALDYEIGKIVVDGFNELNDLNRMAKSRGVVQDIMLRISPSVDPHTHAYTCLLYTSPSPRDRG